MTKGKKRVLIFGIPAIIIILIIANMAGKDKGNKVTLSTPQRATITETIPANGKIQPVTEVKISPDVSGEIIELNYKEGDKVEKGVLIIKIKPDVYISSRDRAAASLNSIKAQYQQQKAQLEQTELTHNRNEALYKEKAISEQEYEQSLSQLNVSREQLQAAKYNVESAQAALEEAENNLVKTNIYAPMSGTISKLSVEKGERVVGTTQMAGTEMFRIANLKEMEVLVDVNENDIVRLKQNDTAKIEIDAYPSRKFTGVVTHIANSAKNLTGSADQITNFEVKVYILPDSYNDLVSDNYIPFRPGMSASVYITTNKKENVLAIPLQCITTRKVSDKTNTLIENKDVNEPITQKVFVYNPSDKTVRVQEITTGIQDMQQIEVLTGLEDSVKIVTAPYSAISRELKNNSTVVVN